MLQANTPSRPFEPGTTGWTAADLDDPQIEGEWFDGRYEIVEGVLAQMSPSYFAGHRALERLKRIVGDGLERQGIIGDFASDVDIVIDEIRVARPDALFMTVADQERQTTAAVAAGRPNPEKTRLLVPPTLVIESVSPGHELHDRKTKRRWYAEFGVPNYWILDYFARSLDCLTLREGSYRADVSGRNDAVVRPAAFTPLSISLARLWESKA